MQTPSASVRQATIDDIQELFRVHQASVHGLCSATYSVQHIDTWFEGRTPEIYLPLLSRGQILVAELGGRIVGFVGGEPGEVISLFVLPEMAHQGIGGTLFALGLSYAQAAFVGPVTVLATTNSIDFYRGFGFEPVEEGTSVRGEVGLQYFIVKMTLSIPRRALDHADAEPHG